MASAAAVSVRAVAAPRKTSHGTTLTIAAIAGLAVACVFAGLVQGSSKTIVGSAKSAPAAEARQAPAAKAAATPTATEAAVGLAIAARPANESPRQTTALKPAAEPVAAKPNAPEKTASAAPPAEEKKPAAPAAPSH